MKIRIEGFIGSYHWGDPERELTLFHFSPQKNTDPDYIDVCPHTIEVEVETPTKDWMTAQTIALLQEQKQAAYAKAAQVAAVCEDKIQQLLALTNEAPAQPAEVFDDIPF